MNATATESVSTAPDLFVATAESEGSGALSEAGRPSTGESGAVDLSGGGDRPPVAPPTIDPIEDALRALDAQYRAGDAAQRWYDLDIHGRAAALGISWRELSQVAQSGDIRIIAKPALSTAEAVFRLRRWFALGQPDADPTRIAFRGAGSVRSLVVDVLRHLPVPVRHYAVHGVTWREVGRDQKLYVAHTPTRRALPGDGGHEIMINGLKSDDELRGLICHELGHGVHRVVYDGELDWSPVEGESLAGRIHRGAETDRERWLCSRVRNELLADDMAALWGFPRIEAPSEDDLYRSFGDAWDEAAALAAHFESPVAALGDEP